MVMYFMPAAFASATHSTGSNSDRIELRRQLLVVGDGDLAIVHHPLAVTEHAVDAPVDEQAEPRVLEPLARRQIRRGRAIAGLRVPRALRRRAD